MNLLMMQKLAIEVLLDNENIDKDNKKIIKKFM